jgi:hypothetical protein
MRIIQFRSVTITIHHDQPHPQRAGVDIGHLIKCLPDEQHLLTKRKTDARAYFYLKGLPVKHNLERFVNALREDGGGQPEPVVVHHAP